MSDRRVLAVSAAFITAAIFLFLLGTYPSWRAAIGDGFSWHVDQPGGPPAAAAKTSENVAAPSALMGVPTPTTPPARPGDKPTTAGAASAPSPATAPALADTGTGAAGDVPTFDIVRVEPNGDSVVAARAKAGATVVLLDQGKAIARAQADGNGQVAFVPPTLAPGDHSLMLSVGEPETPGALSSQSVAVSVPAQDKTPPMVALLQPDQPTRLLSGSVAAPAAAGGPAVSVGAIDVEEMGSVFATGRATPRSQCRIYLNGSFVANVTAGPDGIWSLKIQHGMKPGHYSVRVDELTSASGDVRARAEVPFDYPARAAASLSLLRPDPGRAAQAMPAPAGRFAAGSDVATVQKPAAASAGTPGSTAAERAAAPAPLGAASQSTVADAADATAPVAGVPTVVAQLLTTKVIHGDSLWRISRKMLGHGRRYTQIYAANTSQIRDPKLIYPGQIFVMPQNVE